MQVGALAGSTAHGTRTRTLRPLRLADLAQLERLVLSDCSGVGDASEAALARPAQRLPRCDVR